MGNVHWELLGIVIHVSRNLEREEGYCCAYENFRCRFSLEHMSTYILCRSSKKMLLALFTLWLFLQQAANTTREPSEIVNMGEIRKAEGNTL